MSNEKRTAPKPPPFKSKASSPAAPQEQETIATAEANEIDAFLAKANEIAQSADEPLDAYSSQEDTNTNENIDLLDDVSNDINLHTQTEILEPEGDFPSAPVYIEDQETENNRMSFEDELEEDNENYSTIQQSPFETDAFDTQPSIEEPPLDDDFIVTDLSPKTDDMGFIIEEREENPVSIENEVEPLSSLEQEQPFEDTNNELSDSSLPEENLNEDTSSDFITETSDISEENVNEDAASDFITETSDISEENKDSIIVSEVENLDNSQEIDAPFEKGYTLDKEEDRMDFILEDDNVKVKETAEELKESHIEIQEDDNDSAIEEQIDSAQAEEEEKVEEETEAEAEVEAETSTEEPKIKQEIETPKAKEELINKDSLTTSTYYSSCFQYENIEELESTSEVSPSPKKKFIPRIESISASINENAPLPIKNKSNEKPQTSVEVKAGDGYKTFFGAENAEITLNIDSPKQEWRLFINEFCKSNISAETGEVVHIPSDADFSTGILYNSDTTFLPVSEDESYTFAENNDSWKLFLSSLKEIPISRDDAISLNGSSGVLIGPKSTSLFFYNAQTLKINRKKVGTYTAPQYSPNDLVVEDKEKKSYLFSIYHENAFFEASEDVDSICLECEEASTYGWNVKFENGLFMSVSDIIEFQNRNHTLPDTDGILYRGASRLEFSGVKSIKVYKKPFYYGYGLQG